MPTVAPATAKSPWRRASSSTAKPLRAPRSGSPRATSSSSGSIVVLQNPVKKSRRGDGAAAAPRGHLDARVESERDGRVLGGRVGVGDRSAERAAVADLEMADERCGLGEQRHRGGDFGVRLDLGVGGRGPDPAHVGVPFDAAQLGDARDVDQVREHGEAQREHRHEALAAGEHLRVVAEVGEERHGIGRRGRGVVLERCGLHAPRTVRKNARTSSTKRSGCSIAAKCPPRGMTDQCVTL